MTVFEVQQAIRDRDFVRLHNVLGRFEPAAVAAEIRDLTLDDQAVVFRILPRQCAAAVFEFLDVAAREHLLKALGQEHVAAILNDMAPDDRTALLEELPAAATKRMLSLLSPDERTVALSLLGYPAGSIGRLMTPDYLVVDQHWTADQVLEHIRTHGHDSETINMLYVIDAHGVLIDDIRLREFLLTAPATRVVELMDGRFVALKAADPREAAIAIFIREDRKALPVVDSTGVLIGIVTLDDVLKVAENRATREIQKIGGSEALNEPYMGIALSRMVKKRAGWLVILFLGEMLTATAMGFFENEIEKAVVLALFVPLIISSGGNSGSQATTLVIRAMAVGEIHLRDWWRVMRREVVTGLALGSILGIIGFLRITVWSAFSAIYGPHWILVALTVGVALIGIVLWGTVAGSMLPFVLRRAGLDPATSSAPFVATLVDVTGLVIYFTIGMIFLRGTLL
ncbi:MAG: magnesium transporter [Pseudomonadota bacterium]|nr:magnesium transporter [Pseudomonadota bacterium]